MSRRYYRRKNFYRRNSALGLTRTERQLFTAIGEIIRFIFMFTIELGKGLYGLSKYIRKIILNFYVLKKIGYDLNYVMDIIHHTTPRGFEIFCAELFKQQGYRVHLTPESNDYGRDLVLNDNIFVECKFYDYENGRQIGREIAQKLLGSMQMLNAKKGIIITTGKYHRNAYEVAKMVDNLVLMDITDIQKMILDLKPEQIAKVIMKTKNAS